MILLTPGIHYLARISLTLSTPPVLIYFLNRSILKPLDINVPDWILTTTSVLALPTYLFLRVLYNEVSVRRRASSLGARLVPRAVYKGWFGNIDILKMMLHYSKVGYPGDGLWEFTVKKGPAYNIRVLWNDLIFTTNPDHVQRILATDFKNYVKGERFRHSMQSVLGNGVFNSDGEMWKFHRSMTRPFFSRDRITHFELFDRHAEVAIAQMKKRLRDGYPVDFQDLMGRFTLDSATEFLFGSCFHSLNANLPLPHNAQSSISSSPQVNTNVSSLASQAESFSRAFLAAQEAISNRERLGDIVWPLFEVLKDSTEDHMEIVGGYVDAIVKEALRKKALGGNEKDVANSEELGDEEGEEGETLLDHLVRKTDDPTILRDETLNILLAGRDTTASTLTFIVYFLSIYPQVFNKLKAEILQRIGTEPKTLSFEEIRECRYLRAVINETLRLFPIVPFNVRESINETTWPSPDPNLLPLYIPAGTKISYSVFMMHRRKDLWGPDAEEFDPDRFLDDRLKKYLAPNPFIFLPFNAGPRICLGQQFAYNEMSLMIIRLVQNFSSFSFNEDACPPEWRPRPAWADAYTNPNGSIGLRKSIDKIYLKVTLTLSIAGGLWINAKEIEEKESVEN